jgi:hypothetical protein
MIGIKPKLRIRNINLRIQKQDRFLRYFKHEGDCVNPDVPAEDHVRRPGSH